MTKKKKLSTPEWILEGYDSEADYNKAKGNGVGHCSVYPSVRNSGAKTGKTFKIRKCPKCESHDVGLVLINSDVEEGGGKEWECKKCAWKGTDIKREELNEEEFMKYLDEKGEDVS